MRKTNKRKSLHKLAKKGQAHLLKSRIASGEQIDVLDKNNATPLHLAAKKGQMGTVNVLVTNGANVSARDSFCFSPIHYAAKNGHTDVVCKLIAEGANVNSKGQNDSTPLHLAVKGEHKEVIRELVRNKAYMNSIDSFGKKPLDYSPRKNNEILNLLANNGAEATCDNNDYVKNILIFCIFLVIITITVYIFDEIGVLCSTIHWYQSIAVNSAIKMAVVFVLFRLVFEIFRSIIVGILHGKRGRILWSFVYSNLIKYVNDTIFDLFKKILKSIFKNGQNITIFSFS